MKSFKLKNYVDIKIKNIVIDPPQKKEVNTKWYDYLESNTFFFETFSKKTFKRKVAWNERSKWIFVYRK